MIQKMLWDFFRFMIFEIVVILAFGLGITKAVSSSNDARNQTDVSDSGARLPLMVFQDLFFALFGLVEEDEYVSSSTAMALYAVFLVVSVVLLMNLLIAMVSGKLFQIIILCCFCRVLARLYCLTISNSHLSSVLCSFNVLDATFVNNLQLNKSYTDIEKEADAEWKSTFTRILLRYNGDGLHLVPPPLNAAVGMKMVGEWCLRSTRFGADYEREQQGDVLNRIREGFASGGGGGLKLNPHETPENIGQDVVPVEEIPGHFRFADLGKYVWFQKHGESEVGILRFFGKSASLHKEGALVVGIELTKHMSKKKGDEEREDGIHDGTVKEPGQRWKTYFRCEIQKEGRKTGEVKAKHKKAYRPQFTGTLLPYQDVKFYGKKVIADSIQKALAHEEKETTLEDIIEVTKGVSKQVQRQEGLLQTTVTNTADCSTKLIGIIDKMSKPK
jgi:hypothetical protein